MNRPAFGPAMSRNGVFQAGSAQPSLAEPVSVVALMRLDHRNSTRRCSVSLEVYRPWIRTLLVRIGFSAWWLFACWRLRRRPYGGRVGGEFEQEESRGKRLRSSADQFEPGLLKFLADLRWGNSPLVVCQPARFIVRTLSVDNNHAAIGWHGRPQSFEEDRRSLQAMVGTGE